MRCTVYTWLLALGLLYAHSANAHEYYALGFKLVHPWAEASAPDATQAAVYFKLENVTGHDRLLRASTPHAQSVELRGAQDGDDSDAAQTAPPLPALDIAPADTLEFVRGRPHLLLRGLTVPLQWGRSYMMMMVFERAGPLLVMVSVGAH